MRADEIDWQATVQNIEDLLADGHPTEAVGRTGSAFESLLKDLYGRLSIKLPPDTVKQIAETPKAIDQLGLGGLCGLFRTGKLLDYVSHDYSPALAKIIRNDLSDLVDARNNIVHHRGEASQPDAEFHLVQLKRALKYAGLWTSPAETSGSSRVIKSPDASTAPARSRSSSMWLMGLLVMAVAIAAVAWLTWQSPQVTNPGAPPTDKSPSSDITNPPPKSELPSGAAPAAGGTGGTDPTRGRAAVEDGQVSDPRRSGTPPKQTEAPKISNRPPAQPASGESHEERCARIRRVLSQGQLPKSDDQEFYDRYCRSS